jgi:outer membrane lipoprotein-sorting protein
MKRWIYPGLFFALLAGLAAAAGAQEAKDVLAKMIESQGGRKALESVRTSTAAGTMELVQMGLSGSVTMYQKEPDKMRIDIELMGMVITQAFDGSQAWMTDPQSGTSQEMPETLGRNMKRQAAGSDSLLNPEKAGITYTLRGKEKIGDKDCYVLEQSFSDGAQATLLIDASSGLLLRSRAKSQDPVSGGDVDTETVFEDYRKVGESLAAHKMTVFQGGAEYMRMVFSKIEYNAALDDAFFKMIK